MLLHACPNLQTFSMEWGDGNVGPSDIDFRALGDVLRSVRPRNLESLAFDSSEAEIDVEQGPIGHLKDLTGLKHLTVDETCLLGAENHGFFVNLMSLTNVLPDGLKMLKVTGMQGSTRMQLDPLIVGLVKDERFKALETITLETTADSTMTDTSCGWSEERVNEGMIVLTKNQM